MNRPVPKPRRGVVMGTAAYMAPEQARGETRSISARTDVYALCVILYRMLTGELPFRGPLEVVLYNVMRTPPPEPHTIAEGVPPELETICLKGLAKEPEERFGLVEELADALYDWCEVPLAAPVPNSTVRFIHRPLPLVLILYPSIFAEGVPPCRRSLNPPSPRAP